jgi:hypothetical protein
MPTSCCLFGKLGHDWHAWRHNCDLVDKGYEIKCLIVIICPDAGVDELRGLEQLDNGRMLC